MPYLHYISNHKCLKCDHSSNFSVLYASPIAVAKTQHNGQTRWHESQDEFRLLCVCGTCLEPQAIDIKKKKDHNHINQGNLPSSLGSYLNRLRPLEADVKGRSPSTTRLMSVSAENFGVDLRQFCVISGIYPGKLDDTPPDLPSEILVLWEEFEEVRNSPRYTTIACRKIIETVCELELANSNSNLKKNIDNLISDGFLPKSMGDWAHTIRLLGNIAVHEKARPTNHEASELKDFVKTFLELLYSYPARIERVKNVSKA